MPNKWTILLPILFASSLTLAAEKQSSHQNCKNHTYKKTQKQNKQYWSDMARQDINDDEKSALDHRLHEENLIANNRFGISFDQPTYILPFYYTGNPDQNIGSTPRNQRIMNEELKAQLSLKFPIWPHIYGSTWSIGASYTQLNYWQVYNKSQFFRETDYEPAVFFSDHFRPNWLGSMGFVHQSNGRGGEYERSWNRAYVDLTFSGERWLVSIKPWMLIFKSDSSDLHNKNIAKYLGYERVVVAYKYHTQEWAVMMRNSVESGFQRVALELSYSFPIHGILHGYVQYFHGYGQSLIEYNRKTNSFGVGIALSNWI
jgi:phospholipase A1